MSFLNFTIRARLTVWYTVVLLVILIATCLAIYLFVQNRLEATVREKLDNSYTVVESVILNSGGDIYDVVHLGHDNPFQLFKDGKSEYVTRAWTEAELPSLPDNGHFSPYGSYTTVTGRVYLVRSDEIEKYNYVLAYAQDATEMQSNLRTLAVILLASLPCALILGLLGGYFLAGRALNPVRALTTRAREITAENLSQRLPVANRNDEIGALSKVFNDTLARLESSFEQLKRFTADASHELRTPAASIRTVGEVALQGPADLDAYREAITGILTETERLSRLLDSLLTLARGDAGGVRLKLEPVDLGVLVKEITDELNVLADEKGQSLSFEASRSITVTLDRSTLRLALINVLHNAVKHTPTGGHINVSVETKDDQGAVITVTDNGPGIPVGEREKVFDRFYRIDQARSRATGGVGLGLSIARWAVETNGGIIAFIDPDGTGTCCRITLPKH
jgi:heavy metal sensor kinase